MSNQEAKEILMKAQEDKLTNNLYREYLVGITNSLLGSVSVMVFTNAIQGIDSTKVNTYQVRELLAKEYQQTLTDTTCSIMLDSIAEYYMRLGYEVITEQNLEKETNMVNIRII